MNCKHCKRELYSVFSLGPTCVCDKAPSPGLVLCKHEAPRPFYFCRKCNDEARGFREEINTVGGRVRVNLTELEPT